MGMMSYRSCFLGLSLLLNINILGLIENGGKLALSITLDTGYETMGQLRA